MFPARFTSITFFQKKKDITLYKAADASHRYILKSIITKDAAVRQAFYDEYETLSSLRHPSLPIYYGICEHFHLPDQPGQALTLCMEDCSRPLPCSPFTIRDLCHIAWKVSDTLMFLLEHGILYTDLNPSNLIISGEKGAYDVTLVDYTYCYFFLKQPHPPYPLRFSYNLSPDLRGQQFLIQALTYLLYDLIDAHNIMDLPSSVCQLLETGRTPSESLSLKDFSAMLRHCAG